MIEFLGYTVLGGVGALAIISIVCSISDASRISSGRWGQ